MNSKNHKLFIGCVSRNTIDATIEYANENNVVLGLIPSRRQVDFDGGYVGFNSQQLHEYVKRSSENIILERDHGGPNQGKIEDDGETSFEDDCKYFDIIHIDPWKKYKEISSGLEQTQKSIRWCLSHGFKGSFEISTEQSIREFTVDEIEMMIKFLETYNLSYVVIQSGTSLKENCNTGVYDKNRLASFVGLVKKYGMRSKEHNGDYISTDLIKSKFDIGLDAINIAPEFGYYESRCYIESIKKTDSSLLETYYRICYDSGKWKKWVGKDFDIANRERLIEICGHYVLESTEFITSVKNNLPDISIDIKNVVKQRINQILKI